MRPLTVLLDFDGVIADMEGKFTSIAGEPWRVYEERTGKSGWPFVNDYNETVEPFFLSLDKLPDADNLVHYLAALHYETGEIILKGCTSAGNRSRFGYAEQKRKWFVKHWPGLDEIEVITTESGVAKAEYADGDTLLIDDTHKNVVAFSEAGGLVIQHMNALATINVLEKMLKVRGEIHKAFTETVFGF